MQTQTEVEWRDIPGYEGRYRVSNDGRIYSLISSLVMKQFKLTHGHLAVMLYFNGVGKIHPVHVLVASAFVGVRPPGYYTHHKNEDRQDNRPDNLEYKTPEDHTGDHVRGEKSVCAKLTENQVREIRRLHSTGESSYRKLAKIYEVSCFTISDVIRRRNWRHVE